MTAAELLAELIAQGFCLDVCDGGIGVVPVSQLTDAQIQAIRERKAELRLLPESRDRFREEAARVGVRRPRKPSGGSSFLEGSLTCFRT